MTLGASRIASGNFHIETAFAVPEEKVLIKHERRTLIWRQELGVGEATVVKMYRPHGFADWQRERLVRFGVQREYEALRVLESAGVPCSVPLLWGFGSEVERGRFEILVTREIPDAVSLRQAFAPGAASLAVDDLLPLFDAVRQMHRCGMYHGALYPKNTLVTRAPQRGYAYHLIDMARAIRFPTDVQGTAMARYDLLCLLHGLTQLRPGILCEALLSRYGLAEAEIPELLARLARFRPTRDLRKRLAFCFQVRSLAARLGTRRPSDA